MKKIGSIIGSVSFSVEKQSGMLDEKTVMYIFNKVIKNQYGEHGCKNMRMTFYRNSVIYVQSESSQWISEFLLSREYLLNAINKEIGWKAINDLRVRH